MACCLYHRCLLFGLVLTFTTAGSSSRRAALPPCYLHCLPARYFTRIGCLPSAFGFFLWRALVSCRDILVYVLVHPLWPRTAFRARALSHAVLLPAITYTARVVAHIVLPQFIGCLLPHGLLRRFGLPFPPLLRTGSCGMMWFFALSRVWFAHRFAYHAHVAFATTTRARTPRRAHTVLFHGLFHILYRLGSLRFLLPPAGAT